MINESFTVSHFTNRSEYQKHQHFHDVNQILFSLNEGCDYFLDSETFSIRPGVLVFIPAGTIHTMIHRDSQEPPRVHTFSVHYPASLLKQYSTPKTDLFHTFENLKVCIQVPTGDVFDVLKSFENCLTPDDGAFGSDLQRHMRLMNLLLKLRGYVANQSYSSEKLTANSNPLVTEILHYIDAHISEPLTLDGIASNFFISKYTLCHMFKSSTGFTVVDYVNSSRIRLSCSLLRNGLRVKDAAARVGFSNEAHFIHTFQRLTKITPGKYAQAFAQQGNAIRYNFTSGHSEDSAAE